MIYATLNNDLVNVKFILAKGADINFHSFEEYTALLIAVEQGFPEMVEFLILSDADLTLTRADGQGIFDLVTHKETFRILNTFTNEPIEAPEEEENSTTTGNNENPYSFFSGIQNIFSTVSNIVTRTSTLSK